MTGNFLHEFIGKPPRWFNCEVFSHKFTFFTRFRRRWAYLLDIWR
jgi:hypothetical protein